MEPLFVMAKIIASPGKNDKRDHDHYSTVAFGNTQITLCSKNVLFVN